MEQTLILNATYEPLDIVSWQKAMVLWAKGAVEILAEHDAEKRAVTFSFRVPSVVRLFRFVKLHRRREAHVPFTRANIYRRDDYTCAYCDEQFQTDELTFDHVVPAAAGGGKSWDNIVSCCLPCNRRKGARTPEEAGMVLKRKPRVPSPSPVFRVSIGRRTMPDSWRDWLYWHAELES